jgi:hypothetical protein
MRLFGLDKVLNENGISAETTRHRKKFAGSLRMSGESMFHKGCEFEPELAYFESR